MKENDHTKNTNEKARKILAKILRYFQINKGCKGYICVLKLLIT